MNALVAGLVGLIVTWEVLNVAMTWVRDGMDP